MYLFLIKSNIYYTRMLSPTLETFQYINFLDWFFILPEIYLTLFISLGIIVIAMANFRPMIFLEKKIITKFITNLIIFSFLIISIFYSLLIILNVRALKIAQTYIIFNGYAIMDFYTLF